jgi:hypothetical protein
MTTGFTGSSGLTGSTGFSGVFVDNGQTLTSTAMTPIDSICAFSVPQKPKKGYSFVNL